MEEAAKALIFDFINQSDKNLAQVFQHKYKAVSLHIA